MTLTANDPRHGTENGYKNLGCRCARCREAWRIALTERAHRLGRSKPLVDEIARRRLVADTRDNHGTESRYRYGCRCDGCRAASAQARRFRRLKARAA